MKQLWQFPACMVALAVTSHQVCAQQQSEEEELTAAYGGQTVSIATGRQQLAAKAPSSATVITALDIKAMGATYISEVLEGVPGFHVSRSSIADALRFFIRGQASAFNPETLILVNGLKINTNYDGSPGLIAGDFPLQNVSRIEIIRGPGSALYGADAFSGVINIITKTAEEINGLEVGVRSGSFNSKSTWMQYGGKIGPIQTAMYLRFGKTDGHKPIIEQDTQTVLDQIFNTHASHAPGAASNDAKEIDARIDLSYENFRLRAGYQDRTLGTGLGLNGALDPEGKFPGQRYNLDITYQKNNLLPALDVEASYAYYNLVEKPGNPAFKLLPAGTLGGFADGVIGNPGHSERHHRFSLSATYGGFTSHRLRFGAGHEIEDLYKAEEYKNFTFENGQIKELPTVVNATGIVGLVYITPVKHTLSYVFAQDEWTLAKDWNLTAGIRYDRYSDFGSTTNPRLALVWDVAYNIVLKALHGRAFRAPSFTEQYNSNNPVAQGNKNVKPERIQTNELVAVWQAKPNLQTSLTFFNYRQSDIISYIATADSNGIATATNSGDQTGHGFELEGTWDVSRTLKVMANYSYQRSTNESNGKDAGLAPHNRLFLRSNWRFAPTWQLGTTVNYVANRIRQAGDTRPPIADYVTTDINLRCEKLWDNWEFQTSIKNLFNRDVREPSLTGSNLTKDIPMAGRAFAFQLSKKF